MSGQIAGLVDEIRPVEQVIVDILEEAKVTLANVKID